MKLFKVIEHIEWLAYCLDLTPTWKIHNVISITHLISVSFNDPYDWPQPMHSSSIMVDNADNHYKIKQLLQKWVSCWGHSYITEYLLHWKGYGSEFDIWYNVKDLEEVRELIKKYNKCIARKQKDTLL